MGAPHQTSAFQLREVPPDGLRRHIEELGERGHLGLSGFTDQGENPVLPLLTPHDRASA